MHTAAQMFDPPPAPPGIQDDDLKELFADLRRREQEFEQRRQSTTL